MYIYTYIMCVYVYIYIYIYIHTYIRATTAVSRALRPLFGGRGTTREMPRTEQGPGLSDFLSRLA